MDRNETEIKNEMDEIFAEIEELTVEDLLEITSEAATDSMVHRC